jgi:hypothetical protein
MKHSLRNWTLIGCTQICIVIGGFSLPNSIINGRTWYAPVLDFSRLASLLVFPIVDTSLVINLLKKGRKNKTYLRQFIDPNELQMFDMIEPINFISLSVEQMRNIELTFEQSRDDRILDTSCPFKTVQKYITGSKNHG